MAEFLPHESSFKTWLDKYMVKGKRNVPARLVTLLGLLERLRDSPHLVPTKHLTPNHQQLIEHNSFIETALHRLEVQSPVSEFGRRANDVGRWIEPLFSWLNALGFNKLSAPRRDAFISDAQRAILPRLVAINEDKPILARYNLGTSLAIIADILDQAQAKNKAKDVAQYLVGAKLQIKFGENVITPANVNTPSGINLADFRIGDAAVEVTIVERPDKRHLRQIGEILHNTGLHVWLMTRRKNRDAWQAGIELEFESQAPRVACVDVETFVGTNMSEGGRYELALTRSALADLFERYNRVWLPTAGASGLRIVDLETPTP